MPPTTCPVFTADQWAQRLLQLFPAKWSGAAARKVGGTLYKLFQTIGQQASFLQDEFLYAFNASRLGTATDEALDRAVADFFGPTSFFPAAIQRVTGESDDNLRARAIAEMFVGAGTRQDISNAIQRLTGAQPRIIEPWNIRDCAALDVHTYLDVDTPQYSSRLSNSQLRGTVLVESVLPSFGGQGNYPVYGLDAGIGLDRTFIIDPKPTWFLGFKQMDQVLRRRKTLGTKIYRKWYQIPKLTYAVAGTARPIAGTNSILINVFPIFAGAYTAVGQPNWNTAVAFTPISNSQFMLSFDTPPPSGAILDWIAAPLSVPGYGSVYISGGSSSGSFASTLPVTRQIIASASWNTVVYAKSFSPTVTQVGFADAPAQTGQINYVSFPYSNSGQSRVPAGSTTITIPIPPSIPVPYQLFVMPSWNAKCAVTKGIGYFTVSFSTPPAADSPLYWGIFRPGA